MNWPIFAVFCRIFVPLVATKYSDFPFPTISVDNETRAQTCEEETTLAVPNTILKNKNQEFSTFIVIHVALPVAFCFRYYCCFFLISFTTLLLLLLLYIVNLAANLRDVQLYEQMCDKMRCLSVLSLPFRCISLKQNQWVTSLDVRGNSGWWMCCKEIYSAVLQTGGTVIYCADIMELVSCWDCFAFRICGNTCNTDEQDESATTFRSKQYIRTLKSDK